MRSSLIALCVGISFAGMAGSAAAQSAGDKADARCLMVLQAVARDPKQQDAAARGVFFFLGKIASRGAVARVEPIMLAEARAMTTQPQIQAELSRCGQELQARSKDFQTVNQALQAKAAAARPAAAPPAKK